MVTAQTCMVTNQTHCCPTFHQLTAPVFIADIMVSINHSSLLWTRPVKMCTAAFPLISGISTFSERSCAPPCSAHFRLFFSPSISSFCLLVWHSHIEKLQKLLHFFLVSDNWDVVRWPRWLWTHLLNNNLNSLTRWGAINVWESLSSKVSSYPRR